jgi:hypothetical protein
MLTDERAKQLMQQVGMPDSISLLQALRQCDTEARLAEREAMCEAIKEADDKASDNDHMLDSDDCISVIRGTWEPDA